MGGGGVWIGGGFVSKMADLQVKMGQGGGSLSSSSSTPILQDLQNLLLNYMNVIQKEWL